MATNKNAFIRYKVLDNCFRNPGKRYFIEDLINECEQVLVEIDPKSTGISRRQILMDIAFMESKEGWEVDLSRQRDGKKVYYRYADRSFSINNMPLNDVEINQLQSAVDILSQFKGMPKFNWIYELVTKLKQGINTREVENYIIEFDNNEYLKGIENLGLLYQSIYYKKVLSISYKPFQSDVPTEIILHPYFLKQYNNRWFLYGYNPSKEKFDWNLAIDRIVSIEEIKEQYNPCTDINWHEYFEDFIGVTKPIDSKTENVVLHFFGVTGHYIETKPLHGSQKTNWLNQDTLEVKLQIIINFELERLILSYGESVEVISPNNLREEIQGLHSRALGNYT